MNSLPPLTLWYDAPRARFFLIPDDEQLPTGDFAIHTITGRKLAVDPAAPTSFEMTEDEAKKWLESQLGNMIDTARGAVDRFVDRLTEADTDRLAPARTAAEHLKTAIEGITAAGDSIDTREVAGLHQLADLLAAL